jgi:hypothetical protein
MVYCVVLKKTIFHLEVRSGYPSLTPMVVITTMLGSSSTNNEGAVEFCELRASLEGISPSKGELSTLVFHFEKWIMVFCLGDHAVYCSTTSGDNVLLEGGGIALFSEQKG